MIKELNRNLRFYLLVTTLIAVAVWPGAKPTTAKEQESELQKLQLQELSPTLKILAQEEEPTETPEAAPAAEPQVLVGEVLVVGETRVLENDLVELVYRTIGTQPGRTTTRSQLQEDVNAIYATGDFANVRVVPEDTPLGVRITFIVEPNPIFRDLRIETTPAGEKETVVPPEEIAEIFGAGYGQRLNLRNLQEDIKQLNEWYSENGYDLAQVVGAPQISEDGVVTLVVAEGLIEDIDVKYFDEENETVDGRTRKFIVTREVQLKPGDIFNRTTAQQDLRRVFGLGLFEDVRLSFSPGEDPRKVVVNIEVVESSTTAISAGGGVSSEGGVFGSASLLAQNIGGNNQTFKFDFQGGERLLVFDASFTDPWIGGDPFRTSYSVNAFRRRSISLVFSGEGPDVNILNLIAEPDPETGERTFIESLVSRPRVLRTGGGISFFRPFAPDPFSKAVWKASTGFQYQRVRIQNSDGDLSPFSGVFIEDSVTNEIIDEDRISQLAFSETGEDDLFILRIGASRDKRNNPAQPTSGSFLTLSSDQTLPIGSGSILLNRLRASYSFYVPVRLIRFNDGPQAFAFNIQGGTILGDLPPYEAFILGGSNSVRGYDEGTVGNGRSYLQATAEYRFPLLDFGRFSFGGVLFLDLGSTLGSDSAVPGQPSILRGLPGEGLGYGVGARIGSPLGPIRIDYGINDRGDTQINFGIGQRF